MTPAAAAELARDALIWMAQHPQAAAQFLAESGADPANLARLAADPWFLGGVLDFLLRSEPLLLAFAADCDLDPRSVATARAALPGGSNPHWT